MILFIVIGYLFSFMVVYVLIIIKDKLASIILLSSKRIIQSVLLSLQMN